MIIGIVLLGMLAMPSLQETILVKEQSGYVQAGNQFTEVTQRLRMTGWRLRHKMDGIYQNFRLHSQDEIEDTFYLYVTVRKGEDYSIWLWMNKDIPQFWEMPEIDELVKEFVDRYLILANATVRNRREMFRYYEEALFVLNYVYRKSPERRQEYHEYKTSL